MRQAGLAFIKGEKLGGPRRLEAAGDDVRIALRGDKTDGAQVRDALRSVDETQQTLFMLSYEACVALSDPRSPRKPRDATLGPDVLLRPVRDAAADPRGAALDDRGLPEGPRAPGTVEPARRAPPRTRQAPEAKLRHITRVQQAKEHLLDGVIYQANLAHRLIVEPAGYDDGLAYFMEQTAPCAAFVDVPGWGSVISLSPERFVSLDEKRVARAYPIKGTRPRGADADDDARQLAELCASTKDAAEHVMIVDLLRNDLGKVAVAGGVTVEKLLEVISVKNVHHLESTVSARLRPDVTLAQLIEATVPGGSITGAPKSSAVDVIYELEDGPRGLYTGVLGLIENGTLKSSLLIRTWLRPDRGEGALHVGGGIVVDSVPDEEWQETLDKARAFTSSTASRG